MITGKPVTNSNRLNELLIKKAMTEIEHCPCCGHIIKSYKVSVTPMLVNALIKFRQAVIDKGENRVHLLKDMKNRDYELTRHEWNNFSRQRFLGLAVKVENDPGYWLLTKRGANFLNGLIDIPKYVWVKKNQITERSEERVTVGDVIKGVPYMETKSTIEYRSEPLPVNFDPEKTVQESLI